jgi:hypothetical protein
MDVVDQAYKAASLRHAQCEFWDLDEVDRVVIAVWWLNAEVMNGGFDQYYSNSTGEQAYFAPEALRLIGAHQTAAIVSRANAVFGPDGPSKLRTTREEQLSAISPRDEEDTFWDSFNNEFYAYPEKLFDLLKDFLIARGR